MKSPQNTKLTVNQELFCQLFAGGGEYFNNGVWSYVEAFKHKCPRKEYGEMNTAERKLYNNARTSAYGLLANPTVRARCDEILSSYLNDVAVDKELSYVIQQRTELGSKVSAIKEYNILKKRIKSGMDITVKVEKLDEIQKATQDILKNE